MVKLLDLRFDQLMGHFGFIIGALILLTAVVGFLVAWLSGKAPRAILAALAVAAVIELLLFGPAAPRVAAAFWRLATLPPPPPPSGPSPVQTAIVSLPPTNGDGDAIIAQIWYPAAADMSAALGGNGQAPIDCAALSGRSLASPSRPEPYPILLYTPGIDGPRDDNASTSASLASHGFIVVAIDDIDHDQPRDPTQPPFFDFSSEAAYEATLSRAADKAAREAQQALQALDRLEACVDGTWRRDLRFDHIGFFGYSFGASAAAMASALDRRVVAVGNVDGWIYGRTLTNGIEPPYLLLVDDDLLPGPHSLQSPDPHMRYYAIFNQRFFRAQKQLMEAPDKYGFRLRNVSHWYFTDSAFTRAGFRGWLFVDPARIKTIKDSYLIAFFSAYLRDGPKTLLTQSPSPFLGVEALKGRPHWSDGEESVPILGWMGLD